MSSVLKDKHGNKLAKGDAVRFHSSRGSVMKATVTTGHKLGDMTEVVIGQDPFPTLVAHRQLEAVGANGRIKMPTTSAPSARDLRRKCRNLGIEGWEEMSRQEMTTAIKEHKGDAPAAPRKKKAAAAKKTAPAKKATTKKAAPAKKASKSTKKTTKRSAPRPPASVDTPNPYRPGTNLFHVTEALMKGGKRSALVKALKGKMKFAPRVQAEKDFDVESEIDKRLKVIAYELANKHSFSRVQEGRGPDSFIKVTPPA